MKNLSAALLFAIAVTVSCNDNSKKVPTATNTADTASTLENKITTPVAACYAGSLNKDTVIMKLHFFENVVTGSLDYKRFEKDSNTGNLEGKLNGDTLLAYYKFMSEGTQSVRQVVFLIKDGTATEGYGDMEEKNGVTVFKNLATVVFGKGEILKKELCND